MTIYDIAKKVSKKHNVTSSEVSAIITDFIEESKKAVYDGHEVKIKGLCTLKIYQKESTEGYDFKKKTKIIVPRMFNLKVVFSKAFKKSINNKPIG